MSNAKTDAANPPAPERAKSKSIGQYQLGTLAASLP